MSEVAENLIEGEVEAPELDSAPSEEVVNSEESEQQPVMVEQEKVNTAFAKEKAKQRQLKEKAEELERQLQEKEERLSKLEKLEPVDLPPMPDPMDDDYHLKAKAREDAIMRNAEIAAHEKFKREQQQLAQQDEDAKRQKAFNERTESYYDKGTKLGVDREELAQAGQALVDHGVSGELAVHLLEHEEGPLITKYLSSNPLELDSIANMSPMAAAIAIENTIKPKIAPLKPKISDAPDPPDNIGGGGAPDKVSDLIKGAKFE
jgi:hypothetical protein